ncbi:unnamed protein product [Ilex paraguariensis]|uniref:Uncharacterized protein n=1 Tax=Ilex paraguariensis TaxID=185542 RepID=A0ABC8R0E3_9AQUA
MKILITTITTIITLKVINLKKAYNLELCFQHDHATSRFFVTKLVRSPFHCSLQLFCIILHVASFHRLCYKKRHGAPHDQLKMEINFSESSIKLSSSTLPI